MSRIVNDRWVSMEAMYVTRNTVAVLFEVGDEWLMGFLIRTVTDMGHARYYFDFAIISELAVIQGNEHVPKFIDFLYYNLEFIARKGIKLNNL